MRQNYFEFGTNKTSVLAVCLLAFSPLIGACGDAGGSPIGAGDELGDEGDKVGADCEALRQFGGSGWSPPADAQNCDLRGADLASVDLTLGNFQGADLTGVDLNSADLRSANLAGANLTDGRVIWVKLKGANLSEANLTRTTFHGSDLTGANLRGAILLNTDFFLATCPDGFRIESEQGTCEGHLQ